MRGRVLLVGCPRHFEGHEILRLRLPMRADMFARTLARYRCPTPCRRVTRDDDGRCGQAIMVLGIEEAGDA